MQMNVRYGLMSQVDLISYFFVWMSSQLLVMFLFEL